MALDSYYCPSFDHYPMPMFDPEEDQQLLLDLQSFLYDSHVVDNSISALYSDPYFNSPVPHRTQPDPHTYPLPLDDPFQPDCYFPEPSPKRQKCFHGDSSFSGHMPAMVSPPLLQKAPESLCSCARNGSEAGERREGGRRATAQSVAARDRRKKISDKTQELGKLVPGASTSKLNTAEMLQLAFDYVKFLQAQVSLLQLMPSQEKEEMKMGNLKILTSTAVQEKLFTKDKCLVPVDFLQELADKGHVKSQGSISEELKHLMDSASVGNC